MTERNQPMQNDFDVLGDLNEAQNSHEDASQLLLDEQFQMDENILPNGMGFSNENEAGGRRLVSLWFAQI